jgi:hypothetical protein
MKQKLLETLLEAKHLLNICGYNDQVKYLGGIIDSLKLNTTDEIDKNILNELNIFFGAKGFFGDMTFIQRTDSGEKRNMYKEQLECFDKMSKILETI